MTLLAGVVDLEHSLHGGQAFRWTRAGDAWLGVVEGRVVRLTGVRTGVRVEPDDAAPAVARYLRLEPDDAARRARLLRDPLLSPAMRALPGLRLLRQDPWETTVAFIASANNNVLRIEAIVRAIAQRWGGPLVSPGFTSPDPRRRRDEGDEAPSFPSSLRRLRSGGTTQRVFPRPEALARVRESSLRAVGLGYRAPFVRDAARMVARGDVALERGLALDESRESLLRLPGVGPKVADCVALFALDCDDAFPMDRWMLRAVAQASGVELDAREAQAWARERWGRDAGLAQQYLFHAIRMREGGVGTRRLALPRTP